MNPSNISFMEGDVKRINLLINMDCLLSLQQVIGIHQAGMFTLLLDDTIVYQGVSLVPDSSILKFNLGVNQYWESSSSPC